MPGCSPSPGFVDPAASLRTVAAATTDAAGAEGASASIGHVTDLTAGAPWGARLQLGHAAIQRVAEANGIDLLHVKGFALDESLAWPGRIGSDIDVLVRPAHLRRLVAGLRRAGWRRTIGFDQGSSFGHSLAMRHDNWGNADVHRFFPGLTRDPAAGFEILWRDRSTRDIAGVVCDVPSLAAQALVMIVHAGRTHDDPRAEHDLRTVWLDAPEPRRAEILALVGEIGAEVGFAAATGDLDRYRDRREYLLWKVASHGGTRLEEWRARLVAAGPWRALRVLALAPLVNVEHLHEVLGRAPTPREVLREFFARPIRAAREQAQHWRARRPR